MIAKYGGEYEQGDSRAWLYYNPEEVAFAEIKKIRVM